MVVPVLMTSCQESEKLNRGPVTNQTRTTANAVKNAQCVPTAFATAQANARNQLSRGTSSIYRKWMPPVHSQGYTGRKCSNATETPGDHWQE